MIRNENRTHRGMRVVLVAAILFTAVAAVGGGFAAGPASNGRRT